MLREQAVVAPARFVGAPDLDELEVEDKDMDLHVSIQCGHAALHAML